MNLVYLINCQSVGLIHPHATSIYASNVTSLHFTQQFYDKPFKCRSYIVSFLVNADSPVQYGNIIIFVRKETHFYALVQQYVPGPKFITDYADISVMLHSKAKQLYPLLKLSDKFLLISVEMICHKCVNIPP